MENWIWVIIFIVAGLFKMLGKLKPETEDEPAPRPPVHQSKPPQPYRPPPRPMPRPVAPKPVQKQWTVDANRLQDFVERVIQKPSARSSRVPPIASKPAPVLTATPAPKPAPIAVPVTPEKPSRAAQWRAAMREKDNLRNVIIATEILGPPRGA